MALDVDKLTIGDHLVRPWLDLAVKINTIIDAAGSGGGGGADHYPRLDVDAEGYIIADYGEDEQDGDESTA